MFTTFVSLLSGHASYITPVVEVVSLEKLIVACVSVSQLFIRGGTPKIIFCIPRNLTYKTFTGQQKLIWGSFSVATAEVVLQIYKATTDTEHLSIALNTN
jgi:hypothetical protein